MAIENIILNGVIHDIAGKNVSAKYEETLPKSLWANGAIGGTSGDILSNRSDRIYTLIDITPTTYVGVRTNTGYSVCIFAYNNGTYVGRWTENGLSKDSPASASLYIKTFDFDKSLNYVYKLVLKKDDDTDLSAEDCENLIFRTDTDEYVKKYVNDNELMSWRNGHYISGIAGDDENRIIIDPTPCNVILRMVVSDGYEATMSYYASDGEWLGYYGASGWGKNVGAAKWVTYYDFRDPMFLGKMISVTLRNKLSPNTSISPEEGENVSFTIDMQALYASRMEQVEIETSEAVSNFEKEIYINLANGGLWRNGHYSGGVVSYEDSTRLITGLLPTRTLLAFITSSGYEAYMNLFDSDGSWIGYYNSSSKWQTTGAVKWVTAFDFSDTYFDNKQIALTLRNASDTTADMQVQESANITLTLSRVGLNEYRIGQLGEQEEDVIVTTTWGKSNVLANIRHMTDIQWSPVASIPRVNGSNYVAGTTYKGMLYSSARITGKNVGIDVSFKTFMTALKNPRSVLYTKRSNFRMGKAYYGSVCSTLADYALGLGANYIGAGQMALEAIKEKGWLNLQAGDILYSAQETHEKIIISTTRDKYGRILTVRYAELVPPLARTLTSEYNAFVSSHKRGGYIVLRSDDIDETPYTANDYVKGYEDETLPTVIYPDIMCEYGDEAVLLKGTDVTINVLDATGYSEINIYKGSTLLQTITALEDFTLQNLDYGDYTVTITDGADKSSSSTFSIVDATCSWDSETHILTFSSANGTPRTVWLYDNGTSTVWTKNVDLTAEDIARGYINLTNEFVENSSAEHVRLDFRHNGSTASWFSYFNPAWVSDVT